MVPIEVVPTPGQRRATAPLHVVEDRTPVRKLEFVEVGSGTLKARRRPAAAAEVGRAGVGPRTAEAALDNETPLPVNTGEPQWSLWSDVEV